MNRLWVGVLVVTVLAGCRLVGGLGPGTVSFDALPQDALREAARLIEQAVLDENRAPEIVNREGLVMDTPEVRQAVRSRAARAAIVGELLESGQAWELRKGLVAVLKYGKNVSRKQRNRDALVIMNENTDRRTIYGGILEANDLPSTARDELRSVFYAVRVAIMPDGRHFENEAGKVAVKGGGAPSS